MLLQSIIDGCDRKNDEKENFLISNEASTVPQSSTLTLMFSEYINKLAVKLHLTSAAGRNHLHVRLSVVDSLQLGSAAMSAVQLG